MFLNSLTVRVIRDADEIGQIRVRVDHRGVVEHPGLHHLGQGGADPRLAIHRAGKQTRAALVRSESIGMFFVVVVVVVPAAAVAQEAGARAGLITVSTAATGTSAPRIGVSAARAGSAGNVILVRRAQT